MRKITPILLLILQMNVQAQGLNILDFVGVWEGQWVNTTFSSQGAASLEVTADTTNKTAQLVMDLDGNVLGGADPAPITLNGTYTETEFNITTTTNTFGDLTLDIDEQGNITGSAVNVPNANVEKVDFNGVATPETITLNYTVTFAASIGGGTAVGVLTLNNVTVGIDDFESNKIAKMFNLKQNFPNPFNPNTTIYYSLPNESAVTITVYDILGKEINQLISQKQLTGNHSIQWNGKDINGNPVSAGIYLYQIQAGEFIQTKKMVLMK